MPRCPNCGYILVLLEKRRKYKCAKCSNLYLQKDIESKEFQEWNQRQRKSDKELLKSKKRIKLTKEQKKQKRKEYYLNNRAKILESTLLWKRVHRDRVNSRKRELYQINKKHIRIVNKEFRLKGIERVRLLWRIGFWRNQQKKLTIERLDNLFKV